MDVITILIFMLLYMDDGSLPFNSQEGIIKGITICIQIIAKFKLTIYIGRGEKQSKTEALFILSTSTIKRWREQYSNILQITQSPTEISSELLLPMSKINLLPMYRAASKTDCFFINNNGSFIHFVNEYKYLGSYIDFLLDNKGDITMRIKYVLKVVGTLRFI